VAGRTADRRTGLVHELLRNHRAMMRLLVVLLVVAATTVGYLLLVAQPRVSRYIAMAYNARNAQIATLEQSAALRGWLATGDAVFLDSYDRFGRDAQTSVDELVAAVDGDDTPGLTDAVVRTLLARTAWSDWAQGVIDNRLGDTPATDVRDTRHEAVRASLDTGRRLFDTYRTANATSTGLIVDQRTAAMSASRAALLVGLAIFVVALVGSFVATLGRRRQVQQDVVRPVENLLGTIERLGGGDLRARSEVSGVRELDEIGAALDGLASSLAEAHHQAVARETRLSGLAERFELVVRVGREIAGSLSVRYVASTVASASADLLGGPTTLWVRGEDQAFHAVARSEDPHGSVPPGDLVPDDVVAVAAAEARPGTADGHRAYPLVLAGMVVGVLDASAAGVDEDTEQVLSALLSTAAAALESANLHSAARELADVDALTRLPNRRRFQVDVEAEWERCRRYGRPLSLVMVDLDHFKALNDAHGHLFGDQVLRGAAEAVAGALRASDTAYRYGGGELIVLLRETGLEDACVVAERLCDAVREFRVAGHPVRVTTSAGVAERRSTMAHHTELVAQADAALYAAKAAGRDRVAVAGRTVVASDGTGLTT
jgi:diguanylate cyclase (GGDEF)-like protein